MNRLVILLRGYGEWVKVNCQQAGGLWGRGEGSRICLLYSKREKKKSQKKKTSKRKTVPSQNLGN